MYYSSLGRVKKEPKFSMGKLRRIQKKFGADWRSHVPAAWNAIIDRMSAEYAAATGNRPAAGSYGGGAYGEAGAQGTPGTVQMDLSCTDPKGCSIVNAPRDWQGAAPPFCVENTCRYDKNILDKNTCIVGHPVLDRRTIPNIRTCNPMDRITPGAGRTTRVLNGLGADLMTKPNMILAGGTLAGALAGGSILKEYRLVGIIAGGLLGFFLTEGLSKKPTGLIMDPKPGPKPLWNSPIGAAWAAAQAAQAGKI